MDTIHLRGMTFYGYHGVLPEEKTLGQRFIVHLALYLDTLKAGQSDHVDDTVNYATVHRDVQQIVEGQPKNLIETVAETIATELLTNYPRLKGVRVCLEKPGAPIPGAFESVSVEIERWQSDKGKHRGGELGFGHH